jgi:hypothetical protein
MGGGETARLRGSGGERGSWDTSGGCFDMPGGVSRRPGAAARRSEWGRAVDTAVVDEHVDDDVAVVLGRLRCVTGSRGTGWGEQRGLGWLLDCRLGRWGLQGSSVGQTTCSGEHMGAWACNAVCCAVDGPGESSSVWVAVSEV